MNLVVVKSLAPNFLKKGAFSLELRLIVAIWHGYSKVFLIKSVPAASFLNGCVYLFKLVLSLLIDLVVSLGSALIVLINKSKQLLGYFSHEIVVLFKNRSLVLRIVGEEHYFYSLLA